MSRLQNAFINLLIFTSIWSVWLCFYHGESLFGQLEWASFIGTALLSLMLTLLIRMQLSQSQIDCTSRSYMFSFPILFIPFLMSLTLSSYLTALVFCAPVTLFAFTLFTHDKKSLLLTRLASVCAYSLIYILFVHSAMHSHPYFDAWQVNSYAQSYATNFNHIDFVRQNYMDTNYGVGFPYLFTLIVFIAMQLTQWEIFSYLLANFAAVFIATLLIKRSFRQVGKEELWPYVSAIVTLLLYSSHELQCGGSTVLIFPIIIAIFSILLASRTNWSSLLSAKRAACVGALLGMGLMIRFDFVPFAGSALFLYSLYALLKKQYKAVGVVMLAFFLVISPWIVYSISHFDHIFITDNSRRLLNIPDTRPSSYFSPEMKPSSLFSHPLEWMANMTLQIRLMLVELYHYIKSLYFIPLLSIVGLAIFIRQRLYFFIDPVNRAIALIYFSSFCVVFLIICVHFFDNQRYYTPYLAFFILSVFIMMRSLRWSGYILISLLTISLSVYCFYKKGLLSKNLMREILVPQNSFVENLRNTMALNDREIAVLRKMEQLGNDTRLCAASSLNFDSAKFGARSGFTFFFQPTNLESNRQFMYYLTEFKLNFYYNDDAPEFLAEAINNKILVLQDVEGLYWVDLERIPLVYADLQSSKH